MDQKKESRKPRRPYRKPHMEQVQLVAEEAVLQGCKSPGMTGPEVGACNLRGGPGKCQAALT